MPSFFPRDVLDEFLNLIESVSEVSYLLLYICSSKARRCDFYVEIAHGPSWLFLYYGMLRGTCFVTSGLTFTWANTILWSERPGITEILSTRVGLVVKKRCRIFLPRVDEVTICSSMQSLRASRHSL